MFSNTFEVLLSYKYAKWLWSCPKHNAKTEGSNFQIKFMIDLCNKKGAERRTEGEGGGKGSKRNMQMQMKSVERQRQASTFE